MFDRCRPVPAACPAVVLASLTHSFSLDFSRLLVAFELQFGARVDHLPALADFPIPVLRAILDSAPIHSRCG